MKNPKKILFIFALIFFNVFLNPAKSQKNKSPIKITNHFPEFIKYRIPKKQKEILKILGEFATQHYHAPNAIKKFLLQEKHNKFLNQHLKNKRLKKWIGRIKKLQTTENGLAILEIEILKIPKNNLKKFPIDTEFRVSVGTLNNSNEDSVYKTLILRGTKLYNLLANSQEDEWVVFSGKILSTEKYSIKYPSKISLEAIFSPNFILKFDFFENINPLKFENKLSNNTSLVNKNSGKETLISKKLATTKTISIRYYQSYRLSNYNWDYQNYMNRWHKLVRYHWNNHPPSDYLEGSNPEGGEIFVLVSVKRDGSTRNFQVNSIGKISKIMLTSALDAVRVVPLPPLPEDLSDKELKVEFRFEHSRITNLFKKGTNKKKVNKNLTNKKKNDQNNLLPQKKEKLIDNKIIYETKLNYHEELKQEFSSHFHPVYNFDPNLEIQIDIALNNAGQIVEKKIIYPSKSVRFQLAVFNSLSKVRFNSLPKSLSSQNPYKVRFRIVP